MRLIPQHCSCLFTSRWAFTYTPYVILLVYVLLSGHPDIVSDLSEAFDETHQIYYRFINVDSRLRYISFLQVEMRLRSINGIDVYLRNAESQLSKREHRIPIMLDCINDIMKILLKD